MNEHWGLTSLFALVVLGNAANPMQRNASSLVLPVSQVREDRPSIVRATSDRKEERDSASAKHDDATQRGVAQQQALVNRKLAKLTEFSDEVGSRPRIVGAGITGEQVLDAAEAKKAITTVKARAIEDFADPEFIGVHERLRMLFAGSAFENRLAIVTLAGEQKGVTGTSFVAVLKAITDAVKAATDEPSVRATFSVHSNPTGAAFSLCPQYTDAGCIYVTTPATLTGVFRGYYRYRLTLDPYAAVDYPLNLMSFTERLLDCHLKVKNAVPCTPH